MVYLVGAGPYDIGLLTVKGYHALKGADVVIYDKLANPAMLALSKGEKIYVGKSSRNHSVPQGQINKIILDYAMEGKTVVRLKGGDPYLFGRGAEELDFLNENDIPYEVVPGITSAVSVPAYAGIPVTHRDYASSLHIITGHFREGKAFDINFKALADVGGTLVFLMSIGNLENICSGLIEAGMDRKMPAAVIENGTTSKQRKIVSELGLISKIAEQRKIAPPSIFVVGEVSALAEKYDWFSKLALNDTKVLIAGHAGASGKMAAMLYEHGCDVVAYSCIETTLVQANIGSILESEDADWLIFTSKQGVKYFFQALKADGRDVRGLHKFSFAAVGSETAAVLKEYGIMADFIPSVYSGETLGNEIAGRIKKGAFLLKAVRDTGGLKKALEQNKVRYREVPVYETKLLDIPAANLQEIDFVAFTSGSAVQGFVKANPGADFHSIRAVCIGEATASAARQAGMKVSISEKATYKSIVDKIMELKNDDTKAKEITA